MTEDVTASASPKGPTVRAMFDRIASTYDAQPRDVRRARPRVAERAVAALCAAAPPGRILDLCAGTMDLTALVVRSARRRP